MARVKKVIWDWNGTLVRDMELSCSILNEMLAARALPLISTSRYQEIYDHPIRLIYERAGFDLERESYEFLTNAWHDEYVRRLSDVPLQNDARETLTAFRARGVVQSVLSALPHDILVDSIVHHGVGEYFQFVQGLEDRMARSKIENGKRLVSQLDLKPQEILLVGDTTHDFETASALGVRCVLVARGCEDRGRLMRHGAPVVDDFRGLEALICGD